MRGAIQFADAYDLTPTEKKTISKFLERRMEVEGKKVNPVY